MRKFFMLASAVAMLASCSQNDVIDQAQSKEIKATADIEGVGSKAVIGANSGVSNVTFLRLDDVVGTQAPTDFSTATPVKNSSRSTDGTIVWGELQNYDTTKFTYMRGYTTDNAKETAGTKVEWTPDGATDILLTDVWSAGSKANPIKTGMVFKHQLSRIEVICQAAKAATLTDLQTLWGDVKSIVLVDATPKLTYTFANGIVTTSGSPENFTLLNGTDYDVAKPFVPKALVANGSNNVFASAMVCPQIATVKLEITTTAKPARTITTTLNVLERAKVHKITLSFSANGQDIECTNSTIEDWTDGQAGTGSVPNV